MVSTATCICKSVCINNTGGRSEDLKNVHVQEETARVSILCIILFQFHLYVRTLLILYIVHVSLIIWVFFK